MLQGGYIWVFFFIWAFAMGVLVMFLVHRRQARQLSKKSPAEIAQIAAPVVIPSYNLPPSFKEHLLENAQQRFEEAVDHSSGHLQRDLDYTGQQINQLVMRMATDIVGKELENYRQELNKLHQQATTDLQGVGAEVAKHKEELKAKLGQEIQAEKMQMIRQIDTKIGDAVASFLLETLGHNADLGAQSQYLIQMLEAHKAEFTKELADDAQPAK